MRKISKSVRSRLVQRRTATTTGHPDENVLCAFIENRLAEWERAVVLEHLAECADCRDSVALASAAETPIVTRALSTAKSPAGRFSPVWGWTAGVAATICVLGVAWEVHTRFPVPEPQSPILVSSKDTPPLPPPVALKQKSPELNTPPAKPKRQTRAHAASKPATNEMPPSTPAPVPAPPVAQSAGAFTREPVAKQAFAENRSTVAQLRLRASDSEQANRALAASNTLWSINASPALATNTRGVIQRSSNGGKTWDIVPISENVNFRAVAAAGSHVWAGGSEGALFHSSDNGMHWSQVEVTENGRTLSGTIASIDASEWPVIKLATSSGETWTSVDGGQNWRRL